MLIGYARVSRRDQNTDLQIDALVAAGCERIFQEKRDRPELKAAFYFMRPGDTLVVWSLDRLARTSLQLLETIIYCEERSFDLNSLTEKIDTRTAFGKVIYTVASALKEFERNILIERTCAGLDAARARGKLGGRPRSLVEKDVKQALSLLKDPDFSVEEVATRLGVSISTLYRYLPAARHTAQESC
jgi:DNA invertase Pin-like site-specific DNA recombinase